MIPPFNQRETELIFNCLNAKKTQSDMFFEDVLSSDEYTEGIRQGIVGEDFITRLYDLSEDEEKKIISAAEAYGDNEK
jgi:hypothetical protein